MVKEHGLFFNIYRSKRLVQIGGGGRRKQGSAGIAMSLMPSVRVVGVRNKNARVGAIVRGKR